MADKFISELLNDSADQVVLEDSDNESLISSISSISVQRKGITSDEEEECQSDTASSSSNTTISSSSSNPLETIPNPSLSEATMPVEETRKKRKEYIWKKRRVLDEFKDMEDITFQHNFRMSKDTFNVFADQVRDRFNSPGSTNGKSILPEEKLLHFLFYFGRMDDSVSAAWSQNVSHTAMMNAVKEVIDILNPQDNQSINFCDENIFLPSEDMARREALNFSAASGFPPLLWANADGSHVPLHPPSKDVAPFINRHIHEHALEFWC